MQEKKRILSLRGKNFLYGIFESVTEGTYVFVNFISFRKRNHRKVLHGVLYLGKKVD